MTPSELKKALRVSVAEEIEVHAVHPAHDGSLVIYTTTIKPTVIDKYSTKRVAYLDSEGRCRFNMIAE
jgi:hypothetical protein